MARTVSHLVLGLLLGGTWLTAYPTLLAPTAGPLLGATADVVLDQLGPPRVVHDGEFTRWVWLDQEGARRVLVLHDDRIVQVDAKFDVTTIVRQPRPAEGAYPGQSITELLARMGNADALRMVPISATPGGSPVLPTQPVAVRHALVYGATWVFVDRGRVVSVGAEPRRRATGPRGGSSQARD